MKGSTNVEELSKEVHKVITNLGLGWHKLTTVTLERSRNMNGKKTSVVEKLYEQVSRNPAELPMIFLCSIHQETFCSKW